MPTTLDQNSAVFELELETSKFERNAKKAEKTFSVFADVASGKILTVAQDFKNYLLNDLALNTIKHAFEKTFEFMADYAAKNQELVKVADALGAPVETLSKLQVVARDAGVELQDLADAASALSFDALSESAEELGVNLENFNDLDQAEQFASVVDALSNVPSEADRARLALELFGEAAENLAPLLDNANGSTRDLIEAAKDAGLIATEENARSAAQFADALEKLKSAASGVAASLAATVLPAFQEVASIISDLATAITRLNGPATSASANLESVSTAARKAREEGEKLRALDAGKTTFIQDLAGQGTLTVDVFEKAASTVEELQKRYGDLGLTVDAATRSIEAATDAQERFDAAAKAQRRAEIEKEIAAAEENEKNLGARAQEKLDSYNGLWKQVVSTPREGLSRLTGGAVQSVSEKWASEIDEIRTKQTEERKRLFELRKELTALDETQSAAPEPPAREATDAVSAETDANNAPSTANVPAETFANNAPSTANVPAETDAPTKSQTASKLDEEIARFVEQTERESKSREQNEIDDVQKRESEFRAKLDERIIEERSKGKSNQDDALIERLTALIEESTQREAARVDALKEEEAARLAEERKGADVLSSPLEEDAPKQEEQDDWNPDDFKEYFEDAYKATDDAVKGTAATFSAFDARQIAQSSTDERALKEAERQTRVLEEIRDCARESATPAFA